jgi:hypothetical protein
MSTPSPLTLPRTATPRRSAGALVVAAILALLATLAFSLGGVLLWADGKKDADGYLTTTSEPFAAKGYALTAQDLDVDLGGVGTAVPRNTLGNARIAVTPTDGRPVFIGIGPADEVAAYLRGAEHSDVTDVEVDPFHATYSQHTGTATPGDPAAQDFWSESAHGAGSQELTWDLEDGDWSIVVMNEDGSRGVSAEINAGASVPAISALAVGALGIGAILLIGGGLVVLRTRRSTTA